jgi:esterase/lipase
MSPVIEKVAKALGANVFLTRLSGHGQDGDALSNATFDDWISDTAEAINIGEVIGNEVILIGSSTGCSLIHSIIEKQTKVRSIIYVSPNFGPSSYKGHFLRLPGAKWFIPLILGREHSFTPKNSEHERCWTTRYPTKALFPVKDSVIAASLANHSKIKLPILFWFSDYDKVVSPKATRRIISKMGNNVEIFNPILSLKDDPSKHGVLGDILSPTKTNQGVNKILEWIRKNS